MQKYLRGWARHTSGMLKKEKARMSAIIDELKEIAEGRHLPTQEIELKSQSNEHIAEEEEIK